MTSPITVTSEGNLARITLDDGRGNALSTTMLHALTHAMKEAWHADAVLLTGRARVFCGGLDLAEVVPLKEHALLEFLHTFHTAFRALFELERPLIVAAHGSAVAGGAILLATGDVRLGARDKGLVGVNEARLGIPFPASALEVVRCALPPHEAARALVLGELLDKETALQRGWLHELHSTETLMERATLLASEAATIPRAASAEVKRPLREEFLARMDANGSNSNRIFAQAWLGHTAQERLKTVLARITKS